jgi:hypothetical protein
MEQDNIKNENLSKNYSQRAGTKGRELERILI